MLAKINSCAVSGVDGQPIQVEVDLAQGLPSFSTVGLPEGAVREAKDRVRAAIKNSGYDFPQRRITVNLARPRSRRKARVMTCPLPWAFSLPREWSPVTVDPDRGGGRARLGRQCAAGSGSPPMALAAREEGFNRFLVPGTNVAERPLFRDGSVRD
jgi:magnesium chelatase family protein